MYKNTKKNLILKITGLTLAIVFLFSHIAYASEINAKNVLKLVNSARKEQGLAVLIENEKLDAAAQDKLDDMVKNKYFAHTSPSGVAPWFWFGKNGYDYKYAGENLAISFVTAENQHKAWMASPTHRKNILNGDFQEIGIAVGAGEINGETSIITVQEFGSRADFTMPANQEENFSGNSKENLIEEGKKITPQVLSIKNTNNYLDGGQGKSGGADGYKQTESGINHFTKKLSDGFSDAIPAMDMAIFVLMMLVLFLLPMVFVSETFTLLLMAVRKKRLQEAVAVSPEEYLRVFASYGKAKKAFLGIRMIEIRPN